MWRDRLRRLSTSAVAAASAAAAAASVGVPGGGLVGARAAAVVMASPLQSLRLAGSTAWGSSVSGGVRSNNNTRPLLSAAAAAAAAGGKSAGGATPAAATPQPPKPAARRRLDEVCLELHPDLSRNQIQSWIAQGRVTVDGRPATKAGAPVPRAARVVVDAREERFVCRAGYKLERALDHFSLDVRGRVCLDSGLSTGGFSDCLMQRGAQRVYGVDVGYGQVAGKLRTSAPRLTILERTNLRHLKPEDLKPGCWAFEQEAGEAKGEGGQNADAAAAARPPPSPPPPVSLVTLDLSFISVLKVLPAVVGVLIAGRKELRRQQALLREGSVAERQQDGEAGTAATANAPPPPPPPCLRDALPQPSMVVLIKPQFEAGRKQVGSGGVVRDPAVHRAVIERVSSALARCGLLCRGVIESPLKGDKGGNTEFLGYFVAERDGEEDAGLSMAEALAVAGGVGGGGEEEEEEGAESGEAPRSPTARRAPAATKPRGGKRRA
jgi:23S rRNA (cytidine1920-2'-O)/16S rRNA (cytidine1409-2'-O)-methyltransferase